MNLSLISEFEAFILRKLESAMYENAAEVVREGQRLLATEDDWKARTQRKVRRGTAQLRAGEVVDGEMAVEGLLRGLRRKGGKARRA